MWVRLWRKKTSLVPIMKQFRPRHWSEKKKKKNRNWMMVWTNCWNNWMRWKSRTLRCHSMTCHFDTREPKTCPIHLKPVERLVFKNGWEYYKCPESGCMLFCATPEVDEYIQLVQTQLCVPYRYQDDLPKCFCGRVPVLKVSRSDKNFARLDMACSQRDKCDYFQWANRYL